MEKMRAAAAFVIAYMLATAILWTTELVHFSMFSSSLFGTYWEGEALVLLTVSSLPVLSIYAAYKRRMSTEVKLSWTRTLTLSVIAILLLSAYLLAQVLAVSA